MVGLLVADFALAEKSTLYRCLGKLVEHKDEFVKFLCRRWGELFGARFDVLLYDLTSTNFATDTECGPEDLRRYGYSRDKLKSGTWPSFLRPSRERWAKRCICGAHSKNRCNSNDWKLRIDP